MLGTLRDRPASSINLIGGRICLDFINTMGARRFGPNGEMTIRDENLNDYLDMVAWALHAGVLNQAEARILMKEASLRPTEAARVFRLGLRLREALHGIFRAALLEQPPKQGDLVVLNEELKLALGARQIVGTTSGFVWRWHTTNTVLEKILWLVSESAAELLIDGDLSRLRQCNGDDCGWIFEDTTRNHSRHWCDKGDCGNRHRVRRFRMKQRRASLRIRTQPQTRGNSR